MDDRLKIFLSGLPPDCQAGTLKDYLEGVCNCPGAVTELSIPNKKNFAFITLSCSQVAKCLLQSTLLYCNDAGDLYYLKAYPYVKQQLRRKQFHGYMPEAKPHTSSMPKNEPKPVKYTPPDHAHQYSPDYSMLSLCKPKRKRKKRDDLTVWFGGVGSTSFRKRPRHKKKKKQTSKLELHKNESFQFGNLCPERAEATEGVGTVVHENGQEFVKAGGKAPAVEVVHKDYQNATKSSKTIASSIGTQVIIDHDYLGPLCLQFASPPTVADIKNELLVRTGLPVKDQFLYCNGKKLCDSLILKSLLEDNQESLTLMLSVGSLKGGVNPKKAPDEGATGVSEKPSASQEGAMESMETWDVEKTTAWFCKIGLDKYGTICQEEDINGRALLLIGCKGLDQLVSAFQLKKGPQRILMNKLQTHMDVFNQSKLQTAPSSKEIREWTVKELCNWLGELGIPEECVVIVREEEINGEAFLLYRESGELKECLKLKMGTWIVLEHEVLLHLEKSCHSERVTTTTVSTTKNIQPMPTSAANTVETKEEKECKEPLAASDPTIKSVLEPRPKVNLSKEEERLSLLQNALQLDIDTCSGIEDPEECVTVRSIFVKRGKGANALEKLFNFIVVTKDEMTGDKPRKLWSKIREKTADWIKLLPAKESRSFLPYCDSKSFVHEPTKEKVCLREDGTVGQIFLEKLSDEEFRKSLFVILVDKLLLNEKKTITYNFCLDKKHKHCYSMKLSMKETKYHASFDTTNPGLDLKWSKHFKTLTVDSGVPDKDASDHSLGERKPSSTRDILRQTPRSFASEFSGKGYSEGFILDSWETGSKDLIKPAHEFKLLQTGIKNSEDDSVKKFVYETLRFACGCLNERTNGTIHFGVADEVEGQTCGYQPREIVGSCVTDKPRYNEKLTEFIGKCFVGDSRSNVHNCIRPPIFIPVKRTVSDMHTDGKVIIEVDIEPRYSFCAGEIFKVGFKGLDRGKEEPRFFRRHGSQTKAIVDVTEMKEFIKNHLPKLDEERKRLETQHDTFQGMEKQDSLKNLHGKLKRLLCANKNVLDSSKYPILVLSKPHASVDQDFLDETFCFIQNINWHVIIDFDDEGSDSNGLCRVFKSGPETLQFDIHEAEDYVDETVIDGIDSRAHWIFANGYAKLGKAAVGFKEWNNSDRKKGLSLVMQSLAKKIPDVRAVVLFLLVSNEYEPMADTFKDFCTVLGGPNQLVYVAENFEIVKDWEAKLLTTCLDEHQLRERGVVGMSWSEFKECMLQMVSGIDRDQRFVTMATGTPYPVKNVSFNNIEIVSAKECDELRKLEPTERRKASSEVEVNFYRGYPVKWSNFWFTDDQKNHVLRRDNYSDLNS